MENKIIIPESVHAYTHLGEPVPQVPLKSPKKVGVCPSCNRPISTTVKGDKTTCPQCKVKIDVSGFELVTLTDTTTKHFRQYGLFPSASRLATFGEMPIELSNWYKSRFMNFVMDLYQPNRAAWVAAVNRDLPALESEYADRGAQIHGHIEKDLSGEIVTGAGPASLRAIDEIRNWEQQLSLVKVQREKGHCFPELGIGGTIDVDGVSFGRRVIGDYKTKHSASSFEAIKKGNRSYLWNAIKQLAGYRAISGGAGRAFVIPIRVDDDHPDTGETLFIELTEEELQKGLRAIKAAQDAWCANLDYWPQEMYQRGECWSLAEIMAGAKGAAA